MGAIKTRHITRRRERRIESLERRLLRHGHPRLHASLILLLTGLAGFLVSFVLLHAGVSSMWLRYPVAILVAYCVFLLLLRLWLRLSRPRDLDLDNVVETTVDVIDSVEVRDSTEVSGIVSSPGVSGDCHFAGGGSGGVWEESVSTVTTSQSVSTVTPTNDSGSSGFSFDVDLDEAWLILVAIVALLGVATAALYVVYIAPALLAEILLDGVLTAALYKRVKTIEHRHWLRAALRRTALAAVLVAAFFTIAGYAMQKAVPEARSIGEVWQHLGDH